MRALLACLALSAAAPAVAAPAPETSWGKAGVSYEAYRRDANRCFDIATHVDITRTEPVRALVTASRRIETALTNDHTPMVGGGFDPMILQANAVAQARIAARPDVRFREVRVLLQTGLDECLTELGYVRFRLTDDQREHLRHLSPRRPERRHYLHDLASDPAIIAAQAVPPPTSE